MINATIDISDALAKLGRIAEDELAKDIAEAVANEAVLPELAKYPSKRGGKQPFKSVKQRRFFFAALRKGQIKVPYQRTGALGANWTKTVGGNGITLTSGQKYSDLVRTKGKQAAIHSHWPTTDDIAAEIEGDEAELIGTAEVMRALQKAGLT